jgi:hypothetical protein
VRHSNGRLDPKVMGAAMAKKAKKAKTTKKRTIKKAKKRAVKKAKKQAAKKATTGKSNFAAAGLGCCTIIYDDRASEQVEGVSRDQCVRIGRSRGGTGQWNPGSCA